MAEYNTPKYIEEIYNTLYPVQGDDTVADKPQVAGAVTNPVAGAADNQPQAAGTVTNSAEAATDVAPGAPHNGGGIAAAPAAATVNGGAAGTAVTPAGEPSRIGAQHGGVSGDTGGVPVGLNGMLITPGEMGQIGPVQPHTPTYTTSMPGVTLVPTVGTYSAVQPLTPVAGNSGAVQTITPAGVEGAVAHPLTPASNPDYKLETTKLEYPVFKVDDKLTEIAADAIDRGSQQAIDEREAENERYRKQAAERHEQSVADMWKGMTEQWDEYQRQLREQRRKQAAAEQRALKNVDWAEYLLTGKLYNKSSDNDAHVRQYKIADEYVTKAVTHAKAMEGKIQADCYMLRVGAVNGKRDVYVPGYKIANAGGLANYIKQRYGSKVRVFVRMRTSDADGGKDVYVDYRKAHSRRSARGYKYRVQNRAYDALAEFEQRQRGAASVLGASRTGAQHSGDTAAGAAGAEPRRGALRVGDTAADGVAGVAPGAPHNVGGGAARGAAGGRWSAAVAPGAPHNVGGGAAGAAGGAAGGRWSAADTLMKAGAKAKAGAGAAKVQSTADTAVAKAKADAATAEATAEAYLAYRKGDRTLSPEMYNALRAAVKEAGLNPDNPLHAKAVITGNDEEAQRLFVAQKLANVAAIKKDIAKTKKQREECYKQLDAKIADESGVAGFLRGMVNAERGLGTDVPSVKQTLIDNNPELRMFDAAIAEKKKMLRLAENLEYKRKGGDVGFWRMFWQEGTDYDNWTAERTLYNAGAKVHASSNPESTAARLLLKAAYENDMAQRKYGDFGMWAKAGQTTAMMPSFMLDFWMTGGGFSGVKVFGSLAARGAARFIPNIGVSGLRAYASKKFAVNGLYALLKKEGVKTASQFMAKTTVKGLGVAADALLLRAPMMTATIGAGRTLADAAERHLGDVVPDGKGGYTYQGGMSWTRAAFEAAANDVVENFSEMAGGAIDAPLGGLLNCLKSAGSKGAGKLAGVLGMKAVTNNLMTAAARNVRLSSGAMRQLFKQMQLNSFLGEIGEEYLGQGMRSALGLSDAYDEFGNNLIYSPDFHADLWFGMMCGVGMMNGVGGAVSMAGYRRANRALNRAVRNASSVIPAARWAKLQATIDGTLNYNYADMWGVIARDRSLSDEQKVAAFDYMTALAGMRGFNLTETNQLTDEETRASRARANAAYNTAYTYWQYAADRRAAGDNGPFEQLRELGARFKSAQQAVKQTFGLGKTGLMGRIKADPHGVLADAKLTDEQRGVLTAYIDAKAALEGMYDAREDAAAPEGRAEGPVVTGAAAAGAAADAAVASGGADPVNPGAAAQQGQSPDGDRSAATVQPQAAGAVTNPVAGAADAQPQAAGAMTNPAPGVAGVAPGAPHSGVTGVTGEPTTPAAAAAATTAASTASTAPTAAATPATPGGAGGFDGHADIDARVRRIVKGGLLDHEIDKLTDELSNTVQSKTTEAERQQLHAGAPEVVVNGVRLRVIAYYWGFEYVVYDPATGKYGMRTLYADVGALQDAVPAAGVTAPSGVDSAAAAAGTAGPAADTQPQAAGAMTNPGPATAGVAGVAPGAPHSGVTESAGVAPGAPHGGVTESAGGGASVFDIAAGAQSDAPATDGSLAALPDWTEESPAESRARGYRRVTAERVDRQQPVNVVQGGESDVMFASSKKVACRPSLIEADDLQPSHEDGNTNPRHFLNDAQPKDRTSDNSKLAADDIAKDIDPKIIVGTGNAYTGSPVVNTRGEAIQGNGRAAALRRMYEVYPEQAEIYRQYLIDNAQFLFGLKDHEVEAFREKIRQMRAPVAVNMVDVTDEEAVRLGQYTMADTESGGSGHIEVVNTYNMMRDHIAYFANMLLGNSKEDDSLADLIRQNGFEVIKWMAKMRFINNTQAEQAANNGILTKEARETLEKLLERTLFENAPLALEEAFKNLPDKARRAILAVAYRDLNVPAQQRMLPHLHQAIMAYTSALNHKPFAEATSLKAAFKALDGWKDQLQMEILTGESFVPSDKFSNFAMTLVAWFKGATQVSLRTSLSDVFDLIERNVGLFNVDDPALTLEEAVRRVFKIELLTSKPKTNGTTNGTDGGAVLAGNGQAGATGRPGGAAGNHGAEPTAEGEGAADNPGAAQGDSGTVAAAGAADGPEALSGPVAAGAASGPEALSGPGVQSGANGVRHGAATDNQGNPIDTNGKLIVKQIESINDLTDADFTTPTRSVVLPQLPANVAEALGTAGKPVVIKKNIFDKNHRTHSDLTPEQSRQILTAALYTPTLYGKNQKITRPANWILIHLADKNSAVIIEVNQNKDNCEIVNWHYLEGDALERKKRQAIKEGGRILTLESAVANTHDDLSSGDKVNTSSLKKQEMGGESSQTGAELSEAELAQIEANIEQYPDVTQDIIDAARDYINGERDAWPAMCYQILKQHVRNTTDNSAAGGANAGEAQLPGAVFNAASGAVRPDGGQADAVAGPDGPAAVSAAGADGANSANGSGAVSGAQGAAGADGAAAKPGTPGTRGNDGKRGGGNRSGRGDVRKPAGDRSGGTAVANGGQGAADAAGGVAPAGEPSRTGAPHNGGAAAAGVAPGAPHNGGAAAADVAPGAPHNVGSAAGGAAAGGGTLKDVADGLIGDALSTLAEILKNPANTKPGRLNDVTTLVAGLGVNAVRFMAATAQLGTGLVIKGCYKFGEWMSQMHGYMSPLLRQGTEMTDEQIVEYLKSAWDMKFTYRGERRKVSEWAAILEAEQLRDLARMGIAEKRKLQAEANRRKSEVKHADIDNIREQLPFLLPAQHGDVVRAECQFWGQDRRDAAHGYGKGYLFTNGTGTGKTYTGLGIVRRFLNQGKGRVLIVTVNDTKIKDWCNDAANLGIEATPLADTKSKGKGVVVTQYANLRQNYELLKDEFDLIVYDESHKLIENQDGEVGSTAEMHFMLSNRDAEQVLRREMEGSTLAQRRRELRQTLGELNEFRNIIMTQPDVLTEQQRKLLGKYSFKSLEEMEAAINQTGNEIDVVEREIEVVLERQMADDAERMRAEAVARKTKVVFLSATPFNKPACVEYAEGYIFSYDGRAGGPVRTGAAAGAAAAQPQAAGAMTNPAPGVAGVAPGAPHSGVTGVSGTAPGAPHNGGVTGVAGVAPGAPHGGVTGVSGTAPGAPHNGGGVATTAGTNSGAAANDGWLLIDRGGERRRGRRNRFLKERFSKSYRADGHGDMKATPPGAITDAEGMEEQELDFHRELTDELQTMSGRALDSVWDYSRTFPRLDMPMAKMINQAMAELANSELKEYFSDTLFDYTYSTAFWEIVKADLVVDRIKEHLKLGRKVVLFHRRKDSTKKIECPFMSGLEKALAKHPDDPQIRKLVDDFKKKYAKLLKWEEYLDYSFPQDKILNAFVTKKELENYLDAMDEYQEAYKAYTDAKLKDIHSKLKPPKEPRVKCAAAAVFNGDVSNGEKKDAVGRFNTSGSGCNVFVVQIQSGKEGLSLHDTDGKHQRVMMSIALPESSIEAIQAEGRIYRVGNQSDAIIEYPMLGIDRELYDFSVKISSRAQTTENLAMGTESRGLRDSIMRGALGSRSVPVTEGMGKGGKMADARKTQEATGFDHAMSNWAEWREREVDLPWDERSVPDPLGVKLMEWAGIQRGETVLVANAGEGSVARYIPAGAKLVALEHNQGKLARLAALLAGGGRKILGERFHSLGAKVSDGYSVVNKADVVIVKTRSGVERSGSSIRQCASLDVAKAIRHAEDNGRVLAIVPTDNVRGLGGALDAINTLRSNYGSVLTAQVNLPAEVFGEAATVLVIDVNHDSKKLQSVPRAAVVDVDGRAGGPVRTGATTGAADATQPQAAGAMTNPAPGVAGVAPGAPHNGAGAGVAPGAPHGVGAAANTAAGAADAVAVVGGMRGTAVSVRVINPVAKIIKRVQPIVNAVKESKLLRVTRGTKDVSLGRAGVWAVFRRHIIPSNDELTSWSNIYNIDFSYLSNHSHLENTAKLWRRCMKVVEQGFEAYKQRVGYEFKKEGDILDAFEQVENCARIIEAVTGKTATQLNNIAEGKVENLLSGEMTVREFRDAYFTLDSGSEELDALARRVFDVAAQIEGLQFRMLPGSSFRSNSVMARYNPATNSIELNAANFNSIKHSDAVKAQTVLHETIHAVTCWAMSQYENASEQERAQMGLLGEACRDIFDVYTRVNTDEFHALVQANSRKGDINAGYGLENAYEMIAEMANPAFRAALKAKKLWRQLINGIKKILGMDVLESGEGATTAFEILDRALNTILDNYDAGVYRAYTASPLAQVRYKTVEDGFAERQKKAGTEKNTERRYENILSSRKLTNAAIDEAVALVTGKTIKQASQQRREQESKHKAFIKKLYDRILKLRFDAVTLQKIYDYVAKSTPKNPYGRRISQRLPQRVERSLYARQRTDGVDALFSRASEGAVSPADRKSPEGRRRIEEKKKEIARAYAKAAGCWYANITDIPNINPQEMFDAGKDALVYLSADGNSVVKIKHGKPFGKRFRADLDDISLFNHVFRHTQYDIIGYGDFGNGVAVIVRQPLIQMSDRMVSISDRVEYMRKLGFTPINKENTAFSDGEIIAADIQKKNIVYDIKGNIRVIDADMKLHTTSEGGKHSYQEVEQDWNDTTGSNPQTDQHQRQNGESGERMRPGRQQQAGVQQSERQRMRAEVDGMVKRLRLGDRVTVLTSTEGLDGKHAQAKGWFDTKTGKIVIVLPNHASAVDAVKTVLHEAVGHYGLRRMFGEHFDQFLDNVYKHSELIVRKRIDALAAKHGYSRRVATEEYLSALAERQTETKRFGGVLKTVRLWFKRMLAAMGVLDMTNMASFELTDNELSYILWASRRALERNGKLTTVMQQAADVAMRYKLKVGEFMNGVIRQRSAAVDRDKRRHDYFMAHEMRPVWVKAKSKHPNAVVMVDIGGRFITFGQDANKAAKALKGVINQDIGSRDNLRVGYRPGDQLTVPAYRSAEHFKKIAAAGYPVVVIGKPGSNPNRYDEYEREQSEFEADYLDGKRVTVTYEDSPYYIEPKKSYLSFDKLKRPEKDDMIVEVPTDASLQKDKAQSRGKTGDSTYDNWSKLKKLALPGNVALIQTGSAYIAYNEDAEKVANLTGVTLIRKRLSDGSTALMAGFEKADKEECFAKLRAAGNGVVSLTEEDCESLANEPGGEYGSEAADVAETNRRFNDDIDRYNNGTLPIGYRFDLGMPSKWLRAAGFPELPISLRMSVVNIKSNDKYHPFNPSSLKNLVLALQRPIAVFKYTKPNMRNVIVDLVSNNKHFLVGVTLDYESGEVRINSVSGLFPKQNHEWIKWIQDEKAIQIEQKNKVLDLISSLRTNPAESESIGLNLDLVANITINFKNPPLPGETDQHQRQNGESDGPSELFRTTDLNDEVATEERSAAALLYEERARSASFQVREAWQDSMLGLKALYDAIERSKGRRTRIEDIAGNENAYIFENRLSSLNHEQQNMYRKMFIEPLTAEVSRLCGFGKFRRKKAEAKRLELTRYMMAKHGLERNALMRQKAIEAAVDGGAEQSAAEKMYGERDFAGLTGLYAEVNGQEADVATAELWAEQWAEQYEQTTDTTELWRLVNAATKQTLDTLMEGGVLSEQRRDEIAGMYKYYIPLRGWNATTADEVYGYLTRGEHPGNGSILKKAEGRASVADDPLSMIALMGEHGIAQANRNQMKRTFLNYVRNNPTDLVSINRLWLKYDATSDRWLPAIPDGPRTVLSTDSPAEVARKWAEHDEHMQQLAAVNPDGYKRGRQTRDIPYKMGEGKLWEHIVTVQYGDDTYLLTVNGSPRAAQALNGLSNPDAGSGAAATVVGWAKRAQQYMAPMFTTRSLNFMWRNWQKDFGYANTMVHAKESEAYAWTYNWNALKLNPAYMRRLIGLYNSGELDMNDEYHRLYAEFMANGGETGYTNMANIERHRTEIDRMIRRAGRSKVHPVSLIKALFKGWDMLNQASENASRFAAYATSRQRGRSIERAIWDAKEITVNFNKKGAGATFFNAEGQTLAGKTAALTAGMGMATQLFWNARVQGLTNKLRTTKKNPLKALPLMATWFALGLACAMWCMNDDDDDELNPANYTNQPDYMRRNHLMWKCDDGTYVTVPVSPEYADVYGLGVLAARVGSGREYMDGQDLMLELAGILGENAPMDVDVKDLNELMGWFRMLSPTAVKPAVDLARNRNWMGSPIYKETPFNESDPGWTKAYSGTNPYLVKLSKAWNAATNGGEDNYTEGWADFNPAQAEYVLRQYGSGPVQLVDQLVKTAEMMTGEREYNTRNLPLVGVSVYMPDERLGGRRVSEEYFKLREWYDGFSKRVKRYTEGVDPEYDNRAGLERLKRSAQYADYVTFANYDKRLKVLDDKIKEASEGVRPMFEQQRDRLRMELVQKLHGRRERSLSDRTQLNFTTLPALKPVFDAAEVYKQRQDSIRKLYPAAGDPKRRDAYKELRSMPEYKAAKLVREYNGDMKQLTEQFRNALSTDSADVYVQRMQARAAKLARDYKGL